METARLLKQSVSTGRQFPLFCFLNMDPFSNKTEFNATSNASRAQEQAEAAGVTVDMYQKLDQMVEVEAATLETERLHLSPYYGEAYAEVVNLAAGMDFNFIFAWGPLLLPHERIVIEVLVYLAREQARGNAFQTAMGGERREIPVEIYLEKVPETLTRRAHDSGQRPPLSLTQLTNLHRLKVYEALKSASVAYFVAQEAARRLHLDGRVITGPARFQVRVDPVPTPEQAEQIKHRLAQRHVRERLFLMSKRKVSGEENAPLQGDAPLMSLYQTSGGTPTVSQKDHSVMSDIETSGGTPALSQNALPLMSDIETSGGLSSRTSTVPMLKKGAKSLMSDIETSRKNTLLMSDIETSVMFNIETSLMSEIETSGEGAFLSQNDNSVMFNIETSGGTPLYLKMTIP